MGVASLIQFQQHSSGHEWYFEMNMNLVYVDFGVGHFSLFVFIKKKKNWKQNACTKVRLALPCVLQSNSAIICFKINFQSFMICRRNFLTAPIFRRCIAFFGCQHFSLLFKKRQKIAKLWFIFSTQKGCEKFPTRAFDYTSGTASSSSITSGIDGLYEELKFSHAYAYKLKGKKVTTYFDI